MRRPLTYTKILINYYGCSHLRNEFTQGPASLSSKSSFSIMPAQFLESWTRRGSGPGLLFAYLKWRLSGEAIAKFSSAVHCCPCSSRHLPEDGWKLLRRTLWVWKPYCLQKLSKWKTPCWISRKSNREKINDPTQAVRRWEKLLGETNSLWNKALNTYWILEWEPQWVRCLHLHSTDPGVSQSLFTLQTFWDLKISRNKNLSMDALFLNYNFYFWK